MPKLVSGGTIEFDDLAGSPQIRAGREYREIIRTGRMLWANIDDAIAELFPPAPALPGQYPTVSYLYADSLEIETFHPDPGWEMLCLGDVPTYFMAKATIRYTRLPYEVSTLVTRNYSMGGEFLTTPSGTLKWEPGPDPQDGKIVEQEEISAAKRIPLIVHSINWHRVPDALIPWAAIKANVGKVNDGDMNNAYFKNVADQTLLFVGAEMQWQFSTDGSQTWTLAYQFHERRVQVGNNTYGWNHFQRPPGGEWRRLMDKNNDPMHPVSSTFNDLFA